MAAETNVCIPWSQFTEEVIVDQLLISLKMEDETRRCKLMEHYTDVEELMEPCYSKISQDPEILAQIKEMQEEVFKHKALLQRNGCPIPVSGIYHNLTLYNNRNNDKCNRSRPGDYLFTWVNIMQLLQLHL